MVAVARRTVPKSSGSSGECARDEREVGRKYNPRGTYLLIADPRAKPDGVRAKIVLGSCLGVENGVFAPRVPSGLKSQMNGFGAVAVPSGIGVTGNGRERERKR